MAKELSKQYDPKQVEDKVYKNWLDNKYFHAEVDSKKTPYTIVIPPFSKFHANRQWGCFFCRSYDFGS